MSAPPQHGSPLGRSSLVPVDSPQPPPPVERACTLGRGAIPGTLFIDGSEEDAKNVSVFSSSDDHLEDSDSDEHSRSDSVTGTNSRTTP